MGSLVDAGPVVIGLVVLLLVLLGYWFGSGITGFGRHTVKETLTLEYKGEDARKSDPEKEGAEPSTRQITKETQSPRTLWDWMTVVTISAVLTFVAFSYTSSQERQQRYIQDQQAQDEALQAYLDQMTQMMLADQNPLLDSGFKSAAGVTARVRTVTALKRLDEEHNKIVIAFLKEAGLVNYSVQGNQNESTLRLDQSDLNGVDLGSNNLGGFNLRLAALRQADLHNANMGLTNLTFADLANTNLQGANLRDADLFGADLNDANLEGANFSDASLRGVDLSGANLEAAKNLTQYQINQAWGDQDTKLPDALNKPKWWNNPNGIIRQQITVPMLLDSRFGASLVALKSVKPKWGDDIGIPKHVGTSKKWGTTGALIYDVFPGSTAEAAGLQAGDIIVTVGPDLDDDRVQDVEDLKDKLDYEYQAGGRVVFYTWRYFYPDGWQRGTLDGKLGD